jgi:NAD(P)-dependent dehydrogenase (short-subunit alcohol dehydrogenase family)
MRDLRALFDLRERVAIVTGGAGHIGSVIADALAELGSALAIVDIAGERATTIAANIAHERGVETVALAVDFEDEAAVRALPATVVARFGRLDIIVNCAALGGTSALPGWAVPVGAQSAVSWRRAIEVNLTAPFVLVQAAADALAKSGSGSVINVSSIYGLVGPDERLYVGTPLGNPAAYGASKAGLLQLTRHFATTLAPNVRCNAITPGGVLRGQATAFQERYVERVPLRRMGVEEDFKGAAAFLAADASAYVTGQNIVVDGGWTAW